ncbi:MAG: 50S ribosomal protein L9 [Rhodospirillaceae bacterium]|nr:50S ribosomal protein L9 [Rhodospirillaceae bacterium]
MQIILLERVEKLGQMGEVVNVKAGFARNFLLPRKKALRATDKNLEFFKGQRQQLEATNLQRKQEAEKVAAKMQNLTVVVVRQAGESGQLYGSVTVRDLANAIVEMGFTVDKRQIVLNKSIKALGLYPIQVQLHPEVKIEATANIAQSLEEAAAQQKNGGYIPRNSDRKEASNIQNEFVLEETEEKAEEETTEA